MADPDFPCSITLSIPFPTRRLANIALSSISVDKELSPLVRRTFSLQALSAAEAGTENGPGGAGDADDGAAESVLRVVYSATTNRMLRVATNSFMDSLGLVAEVMEKMDVDVLAAARASAAAVEAPA